MFGVPRSRRERTERAKAHLARHLRCAGTPTSFTGVAPPQSDAQRRWASLGFAFRSGRHASCVREAKGRAALPRAGVEHSRRTRTVLPAWGSHAQGQASFAPVPQVASWLPRCVATSTCVADSVALHSMNQQTPNKGLERTSAVYGERVSGTLAAQPSVRPTSSSIRGGREQSRRMACQDRSNGTQRNPGGIGPQIRGGRSTFPEAGLSI